MPKIPGLRRVFRLDGGERRVEREVDEEVAFHLEMRMRDLAARGMASDEARREAARRFGDVTAYRAELGAIDRGLRAGERRADWWTGFAHDVRHSLRGLRAQPGFTAAVVLTFALGIGANATMVGLLDRLLLRAPAHVVAPERVVRLDVDEQQGATWTSGGQYNSYPALRDVQQRVPALAAAAGAAAPTDIPFGRGAEARLIRGTLVSGEWFPLLGAQAAVGRLLTPADDRAPDGEPVVVLGHGFWRRELGGRPDVVGRTLEIAGTRYTVVGVAPEGFAGTGREPLDVYLPMHAGGALRVGGDEWKSGRHIAWLEIVGRLRPGATAAQAAAQATAAYRAGEAERDVVDSTSVARWRSVLPREANRDAAEARVALLLAAVSTLVLLIACANVANLLLARALRREREIAVRLALGVSRRRLVTQLVSESLLLALAGGLVAMLLVWWGSEAVRQVLFGDVAWAGRPVDGRVLLFAAAATLVTGALAGLAPALQASRPSLSGALRQGAREGGSRRGRTRAVLLVAQAAMSVVLLVGTGLFVRSLRNVNTLPLGLDAERVVIGEMNFTGTGIGPERRQELFDLFLQRARAVGGVRSAALGVTSPFGSTYAARLSIPGLDSLPAHREGGPYINAVTEDFFTTLGARVVQGRAITADDRASGTRVVVVNEALARHFWPGQSALGRCMRVGGDTMPCSEVVGVVANMRRNSVLEGESLQYFVPLGQQPSWLTMRVLFVRPADGAEALVLRELRRAMQTAASDLPYAEVRPLRDLFAGELRAWRIGATMFGAFGALALLLSAVGLHGVISYGVAQRRHEMGVRMALGADARRVVGLVVRQGVGIALAGALLGTVAALAAAPRIGSLLFETSPRDPLVYGGVVAVLLLVALLATLVPAWRASRVDPVVALRAE